MILTLLLAVAQFGPDTTATGINTGQGIVQAGLHCDPPSGPPNNPLVCSGYLASSVDGTMLDTTVWVPRTGAAHPLVVGIHGWGGSKTSNYKYAPQVVDAGFTFLSYSTRGFGNSYGLANLADVNVEGEDLRSIIGQVVDDPRLHADPSSVGVFGASYGGAHAFLAATRPRFFSPRGKAVTIRTVAPLATWTELTGALRPNGRPLQPIDPAGAIKFSLVEALYIGGCNDTCSNYPAYLHEWNARMASEEPNNTVDWDIVSGLSGYRSVWRQDEFWQNRVPIFLAQGWTDDLFPVDETLRLVHRLKAANPDYPVAVYFGDIGHPRARNKPAEVDFVIGQVIAWLQWYLEGVGTQPPLDLQAAITRPKDAPFNPADVIRVADDSQLATSSVVYSFNDPQAMTFNPANTSGVFWDPAVITGSEELAYWPDEAPPDVVPGDVAAYEVAAGQAMLIAGQPQVSANVTTTGVRVQFDVRLFDIKPDGSKSLITRGTYTFEGSAGATTITIPTYGNLWPVGASDIIRLEITNVDSPYVAQSKVPSASAVNSVTLSMPIH